MIGDFGSFIIRFIKGVEAAVTRTILLKDDDRSKKDQTELKKNFDKMQERIKEQQCFENQDHILADQKKLREDEQKKLGYERKRREEISERVYAKRFKAKHGKYPDGYVNRFEQKPKKFKGAMPKGFEQTQSEINLVEKKEAEKILAEERQYEETIFGTVTTENSISGNNSINGRVPMSAKLRHEVFKRDNYRCRECGMTNKETILHVDHINPVSKGGTDDLKNLQTLCKTCNLAKHTRKWEGGK